MNRDMVLEGLTASREVASKVHVMLTMLNCSASEVQTAFNYTSKHAK